MTWLAILAGAVVAVLILLGLVSRLVARLHLLETPCEEVHEAATRDGWLIALHRYRPLQARPGREPVLICHGLLSTRFSLDLDDERSLARSLRQAGFDVWLMDLRAHGDSRRDPAGPDRRSSGRFGFDWSLDEYVREDLPAAVQYVLRATGASSLHWIGHSLGGMMLYAHCVSGETGWFRSAVSIDSPGHFGPLRFPTWPLRIYAHLVPVVPVLIFKPVFHLLVLLLPEHLVYRDMLLERRLIPKVLYNALIDWGSSRALLQLARMLAEGRFRSLDGSVDYEEGPARIRFPLMVLRAPRAQAPEACVRHAFDQAKTDAKRWVRCGREEGFTVDHNHFSLVLGRSAPAEIFPLIADWLKSHSSA